MVLLSSGCMATFEGLPNVHSSSTTHNSDRATSRIAIACAMSAKVKKFSFVVIPLFCYSVFLYSTFYQLPKRNRIVDANNTLDTYELTDSLCCTCSCSSHSHHIFSSHWHTVITWRRIWGWLKGVATPPSCAPGKAHTLHVHNRPRVETDPVLSDMPTCDWTCAPWIWIRRILEEEVIE